MDKKSFGGKVSERYFGQKLGNTQDPDEPYDKSDPQKSRTGYKIGGMGSQGGGSKPTPQASLSTTGNKRGGSYPLSGSYPRSPQKLRG